MTKITTGYEDEEESSEFPLPSDRQWKISQVHIGTTQAETLYANVSLDGEIIGSIRFPNREHFDWFRRRINPPEEK